LIATNIYIRYHTLECYIRYDSYYTYQLG